jgi:hypothetical protein
LGIRILTLQSLKFIDKPLSQFIISGLDDRVAMGIHDSEKRVKFIIRFPYFAIHGYYPH